MTKLKLPDGRTVDPASNEFKVFRLDSLITQCEGVMREHEAKFLEPDAAFPIEEWVVSVKNHAGLVAAVHHLATDLRDHLREAALNSEAMRKQIAEI